MSGGKVKTLTDDELKYIRENCLNKTDAEIAKHLERDIRTVTKYRRRLGVEKGHAGKIKELPTPSSFANSPEKRVSMAYSESRRKEFFKTQLQNSLFYHNLKEQFTPNEVSFYLEEWGALCCQFEDIVASEARQIDELIKAEIIGNRILRNIKATENTIGRLVEEAEMFSKVKNLSDDEEAQERYDQIHNLIRTLGSQSQAMTNDYQKNVDSRNKLLNELNARRRDRIDQIQKGGTTILGIIRELQTEKTRRQHDRHFELIKMSKDKKAKEWRKPQLFPDGSRDCIVLDSESEIIDPRKNDYNNRFDIIDEFLHNKNKRVLIVDDEIERAVWFSQVLSEHQLDFASNVEKAQQKLKSNEYDLVCFDYDLGAKSKGIDAADYMIKIGSSKNAKAIIHSVNEEGAKEIQDAVLGERELNMCSFYEMKEYVGEQENAKNSTV